MPIPLPSRRSLLAALTIFAVSITGMSIASIARAADDTSAPIASAYLVMAGDRVLWHSHERERLPAASLAKIMTALLAVERGRLDDIVVISAHSAAAPGRRLGLRRGERMSAADLLRAMLMHSANDACRALAEWHSGSEARFVEHMNGRATQLGLADTHFENACGYDAPGQYTSAADLAKLAELALADPRIAQIARLPIARVYTVGGRSFLIRTSNALLNHLPGAIGLKAGYTGNAGYCIAAVAQRNGARVLLVMLNARHGWRDAHEMMERAFAQLAR